MNTGIIRSIFLQHYVWQNWNISFALFCRSYTNNLWSSALKRFSFISLHESFTKWTRIVTIAGVEDIVLTKPYRKYQHRMENNKETFEQDTWHILSNTIFYHFLICKQIIFAFLVGILQNITDTSPPPPIRLFFENSW